MTLIVFIAPVIPLFPLKMVGLWLLAHQYWMSAVTTLLFAKFVGVGVTAFVFDVTRPKLLEMAWFEKLYEFVLALRAKCHALVEPVKVRILAILRGDGEGRPGVERAHPTRAGGADCRVGARCSLRLK